MTLLDIGYIASSDSGGMKLPSKAEGTRHHQMVYTLDDGSHELSRVIIKF